MAQPNMKRVNPCPREGCLGSIVLSDVDSWVRTWKCTLCSWNLDQKIKTVPITK